jgi:hypothetical protein
MGERDQRSEALLHELGALVSEIASNEDVEVLVEVARRLVRGQAARAVVDGDDARE